MEKKINFSFRFLLRALAAWIITVLPLLFIAAFIANKLSVDTSGLAYISAALSSIAAAAAGARGVSAWQGAGLLANGAAIGGAIAAIYWLLMLVGRSASSVISGKVATRTQLIVVSATAICFILIAIFTPKEITVSMPGYSVENGFEMASVPVSALFLVLCGLCTSIMWGGIFNLAVEGLGKYTAQASGIFMMMVVGGGIFPLLQQFISDAVGYMASYWLIIALLAYLLFYGLVGCKNVNKDIPVE